MLVQEGFSGIRNFKFELRTLLFFLELQLYILAPHLCVQPTGLMVVRFVIVRVSILLPIKLC